MIAKVHVDSWRSAYRDLVPDDKLAGMEYKHGADRFRESILAGSEEIYIAEEAGKVVGFLVLGNGHEPDVREQNCREIFAFYLVPECWRKGIGRTMWQKIELILKFQTYSQVVLWVFERNERARQFYEAMGFRADGATKVLNIGAPLDAVRYSKNI